MLKVLRCNVADAAASSSRLLFVFEQTARNVNRKSGWTFWDPIPFDVKQHDSVLFNHTGVFLVERVRTTYTL